MDKHRRQIVKPIKHGAAGMLAKGAKESNDSLGDYMAKLPEHRSKTSVQKNRPKNK